MSLLNFFIFIYPRFHICHTFFSYKNHVYKNVEAKITLQFKNVVVIKIRCSYKKSVIRMRRICLAEVRLVRRSIRWPSIPRPFIRGLIFSGEFYAGSTYGPVGPWPRAPRLGGPRTWKILLNKKKKEEVGRQ